MYEIFQQRPAVGAAGQEGWLNRKVRDRPIGVVWLFQRLLSLLSNQRMTSLVQPCIQLAITP
jgi:hypothetical protein